MSDRARQWIRWFVDYSALFVFALAFFVTGRDMQTATWALVIGSVVAFIVGLTVERRIAPFPAVAGGAALVFGGLSLIFHDPRLLKIKPTVMNGLFAVALFGGLALKKNPLRLLLGDAFEAPPHVWRRLTINYGLFFAGLALLNEAIWRTQSDAVWVVFRFPGMLILTLIFSFAHAPLLVKYVRAQDLPPPPTE